MKNERERMQKETYPNLRFCPLISLERLRKTRSLLGQENWSSGHVRTLETPELDTRTPTFQPHQWLGIKWTLYSNL